MRFSVHVPATTANLGAGFDCLGLALSLENVISVESSRRLEIDIAGEGASILPRHPGNRVVRAMQRACNAMGKALPPVRLCMHNTIPLARGMGSSAAAAVGGLLAANRLHGTVLSQFDILALATELEGHPDNVAPALLGGMCVVAVAEGKPLAVRLDWAEALKCVVFVPDTPLSTAKARSVLPASVARADAVFNTGRAALWVAALTQSRYDLIGLATQDRLHQPYRAPLVVGFDAIVAAALRAGARGAFLSGAGSSIAAIVDADPAAVALAMEDAARGAGQTGKTLILSGNGAGATIREA